MLPPDSQLTAFLRALLAAVVREEVGPAVRDALDDALPGAIRAASTPAYLSREGAAEYIGRSVRSLDHLRKSGRLPYSKRGRRVVIATADLDAFLAEGHVPARQSDTRP